jgi:exopolysaccharide biosynthesis polyprenyl glycosylphosphotransferase
MTGYELIGTMWLLFFIFSYFPRLIITSAIASRVSQRKLTLNTLIIGASENALELYNRIKKGNQSMGFDILGFVETDEQSTAQNLPLERYKMSDIENLSKKLGIQNFIIAPIPGDFSKTINIINRLFPLDCAIYINPDLYHLITSKVRIGYISGEPLIDISKPTTPAYTQNIKRLADIIVASLSLIVLSPLLLYIAIAVKRDSEGPVIYKQERIGLHKRPFKILKFRSMRIDAESESGPTLSNTNDNRITKIGHFLRKYRLDELPQFWNVIKGDMSLVGPRPEREYYIKQIITRAPYYALIHQVRPGITSWGMVKYGYASTVDAMIERLKYDLIYIENISMVVDLKILLYTINTVITGKGI